jgi:hypothetical protein
MSARSESILDHIADYLRYISNAQLFWFMLDTSFDHSCHLAKRFRLNQLDYDALLIIAGLASYTRLGFTIKPTAWSKFVGGHQFVTNNSPIEFDQKKIDLDAYINVVPPSQNNRRKFYVVGIGNKTEQSPNKIDKQTGRDGQLITTPPWLNGLGMKCQTFWRDVGPLIWDFIVENNKDGNDDDSKDDDNSEDDEDNDDNKNSNIKEDNDACSPTKNNKKRKYSPMMVGPGMVKLGGDDINMDKLDLNLSRALGGDDGFNPTNPSVQKSMRSLLSELNDSLSTKYQLDVNGLSNNKISYVRVPRARSDRSFLNTKE